ncbi:hypothetical protein AB0B28_13760 [Glycomyces sp. NPDC046736]|uniref:hypothetical protein n=1 Tax=Glycomyces sp. NPDC046736 TaxID=3155615 RepID=UPI0033C25D18
MKTATGRIGLIGAASAVLLAVAVPVQAQDIGYADWSMEGGSRAYTGTMALPGGFPEATFTSDARAQSGIRSGANTWLGPNTPFGEVYGSSRDREYALIRPFADTPGNPSTTTYTFAEPTPASQWGFALGDIDADTVTISATDANGDPVPASALGYQGSFNFCDTSPRPGTCSGITTFHQPTWTEATATLAGDGNDETGGTGWFQPTVPIATLTFSFSALSGFPVYQTWFATLEVPEPDPDPTDDPTSDGPTDDEPTTDEPTSDDPNTEDPSAGAPGSNTPPADGSAKPAANNDAGTGSDLPITGVSLFATLLAGLAALTAGVLVLTRRRSTEH